MKIEIEWEEAPGVRDAALAATWARIAIFVGDQCITEGMPLGSSIVRQSIYGSVLPLTAWLLENWWNLLYEPRSANESSAQKVTSRNAPWLRRHNLVSAKEGFALPDCSIFSDEDSVRFEWAPDYLTPGQRIRFIGQGFGIEPRNDVIDVFSNFINRVLAKLVDSLGPEQAYRFPECHRMFSAWQAIRKASAGEMSACRLLGTLGLDPYDPDDAPDELIEVIERVTNSFPENFGRELTAGSAANSLGNNVKWVHPLYLQFPLLEGLGQGGKLHGLRPFEAGYKQAHEIRVALGNTCEPIHDLTRTFASHLHGGFVISMVPGDLVDLQGFLGQKAGAQRVLALPIKTSKTSERFSLARAAYLTLSLDGSSQPALLTDALTWSQQASRAFGAEFLAPAAALKKRINSARITDDQVNDLATEFIVSPRLVRYQIENHDLANIVS